MVFNATSPGGAAAGYEIDQSCRFDSDTPAYLARTFGTPTSDKIWTFSLWVKICKRDSGSVSIFMGAGDYNADYTAFLVTPDFKWDDRDHSGAAWKTQLRTNAVYRDPSAWYHIVYSYDSTPSTPSASSIKMFVNGEQLTSFSSETYPSQNTASVINTAVANWIGGVPTNGATYYFDGYMAEVVFVDGTALDADSFGETNSTTGQWIPKAISGLTFGNNGFHLDFADSSSLGNDVSGNDNDWATSGLAAADQVTDSPTNNFCTLNVLNNDSMTVSDGNLAAISPANAHNAIGGTFAVSSGKWYWEFTAIGNPDTNTAHFMGVAKTSFSAQNDYDSDAHSFSDIWAYAAHDGDKMNGSGQVSYGVGGATNTVYSCALDMDNGKIYWGITAGGSTTWEASGDPAAGSNAAFTNLTGGIEVYPIYTNSTVGCAFTYNFGQSGFGATPPTGFKALSTANLDDPTIADPSGSFQSTIYTGDGATTLAVNQGGNSTFTPDFVWVKNRDQADSHLLFDLPRAVTNYLISNTGGGQATGADTVESFDSDGFTVGDDVRVNTSGEKYVGWQWLESDTAGFDVFTFTGTGSAHTISHSLGVVPELIIIKNQNITSDWWVYHAANTSAPATDYLVLNGTDTTTDSATAWNDTAPTSSVFTVGTASNVNGDGNSHIAYIFAPVESFSKFGSYTGNGNADGPFVWCGFRPAFIVEKNTNSADDWVMWDNQRNPYNVSGTVLKPNTSGAETTATSKYIDFLSNGFKLRASDTGVNGNGNVHCFWAFSDTPFKTATAR